MDEIDDVLYTCVFYHLKFRERFYNLMTSVVPIWSENFNID